MSGIAFLSYLQTVCSTNYDFSNMSNVSNKCAPVSATENLLSCWKTFSQLLAQRQRQIWMCRVCEDSHL
jgi:hypothetical protein